jgi:cyclic pyranopterin phosphate synthase
MPAVGISKLRHEHLMSLEQLAETVAWLCRELGVGRIKLTGGEPLVRRGVVDLVHALAATPGVTEISATTNGARLVSLAGPHRDAGLSRVNISVDSLDPRRFADLTRGGRLDDTLAGIDAALSSGMSPVKLNAVLLGSYWLYDVPTLLDFAARRGLEIRFIELMRTGTEVGWAEREFVSAEKVRGWLERRAELAECLSIAPGPARSTRLLWNGVVVDVGWITPRSRPFCDACARLRLDAKGRVRRCLMDPVRFNLAELLETTDGTEVGRRLREYLAGKVASSAMESNLPMVSMGG